MAGRMCRCGRVQAVRLFRLPPAVQASSTLGSRRRGIPQPSQEMLRVCPMRHCMAGDSARRGGAVMSVCAGPRY